MEYYVRHEGPVMVKIVWIDEMNDLGDEDVIYGGPIYASAFNIFEEHGVLIVGFGPDYWVVRNSHGIEWGNHGYAKLTRRMVHGRSTLPVKDSAFTDYIIFWFKNETMASSLGINF
ncbi:macrodontain-1 [Lathyrus oleraceus]|uniref:macrodontain-1 n=1 Tax=Pisum sativum TaxID=3888 RepID=UPI0021D2F41D|nr:macrodontain-1-like [Pisum sativum]